MEAVRHAHRQTDCRGRLPGEVLGIKDNDVAEVPFRVIDVQSHTVFMVNGRSCESNPLVLAIIVAPSAATM